MLQMIPGGFLKAGGVGKFLHVNVTDEDSGYQIDGISVMRTGGLANNNLFLGEDVFTLDEGVHNVGIGTDAGRYSETGGARGNDNVYIGYEAAMGVNLDGLGGEDNVAIGHRAMKKLTNARRNVAVGKDALTKVTTGYQNLAIGYQAGSGLITGIRNTFMGASSGFRNNGSDNFALGFEAMAFCTGSSNAIIGAFAGRGVNGSSNYSNVVMIGYYAGLALTTGGDNVFIGNKAGMYQTTNGNLLIIDNQDRGSVVNETTRSLLYGVFAAAAVDQYLRVNAHLRLSQVKSGATQAASGAAAHEIWKTAGHASLPNNVLMIGV